MFGLNRYSGEINIGTLEPSKINIVPNTVSWDPTEHAQLFPFPGRVRDKPFYCDITIVSLELWQLTSTD